MIDMTQINEYIRDRYESGIGNLMWQQNFLLNRIKASNLRVDPANFTTRLKCRIGANQGLAWGDVIPVSGHTKTIDQTIALKRGSALIEVDEDALAYTPNDPEMAFMGALSGEMASLLDTLNRNIEVSLQGNGDGVRATVTNYANTGAATCTLTVTSPNFAWLEIGMIIDIIDNATGLDVTKYEIVGTDSATMGIDCTTVNGAALVASGVGNYITNQLEYNAVMMGLYGICDDGTNMNILQGINSTTYELWRAKLDDNGGVLRPVTKKMLDDMITWGNRSGGMNLIYTTENLMWSIANLLEAQRQWTNVSELDGGFTGLKWAGKEIFADMYARSNRMNFLNTGSLGIRQLKGSANGMFNAVSMVKMGTNDYFVANFTSGQKAQFRGMMNWHYNFVTTDRKANGAIDDIQ